MLRAQVCFSCLKFLVEYANTRLDGAETLDADQLEDFQYFVSVYSDTQREVDVPLRTWAI